MSDEDVVGVFEGPAHICIGGNKAFMNKWGHILGMPAAEATSGAFYTYCTMVMDRVYMTGKSELIEVVVASYSIAPWTGSDGEVQGVTVTLRPGLKVPSLVSIVGTLSPV